MILPDVNILVYAHRQDAPDHRRYLDWLVSKVDSDAAFGLSPLVLSGFIRVVTHPKVFKTPSTLSEATAFAEQLRERPNCIEVTPGARHWTIFRRLCHQAGAKGNLVPDAYLAAMAIESGCEWVTADRDFSRFEGLKWRHPLAVRGKTPHRTSGGASPA